MKKLLIGLLAIGSLSAFSGTIIVHKTCIVSNSSYSIIDASGNFSNTSFEAMLLKKGYTIATSEDSSDTFSNTLTFDYSYNSYSARDTHIVSIKGFKDIEGNEVSYNSSARSIKSAIKNLPSCRQP